MFTNSTRSIVSSKIECINENELIIVSDVDKSLLSKFSKRALILLAEQSINEKYPDGIKNCGYRVIWARSNKPKHIQLLTEKEYVKLLAEFK